MSRLRVVRRGKHRPKAKKNTEQRSVFAILSVVEIPGPQVAKSSPSMDCKLLACRRIVTGSTPRHTSVNWRQAAHKAIENLKLHGLSISLHDSILVCIGLLILFFIFSITAAFASSSMSSSAVEAGRAKIMDSYFKASWEVQSAERLGHVQQLLTVNCDNIGLLTQSISTGLQGILSALALLLAAFIVNPVTAGRGNCRRRPVVKGHASLPHIEPKGLRSAFK